MFKVGATRLSMPTPERRCFGLPCILESPYGSPPRLYPPLALRPRSWRPRPPTPPLALPPRARPNLFLRLLLPSLPSPRPDRLQRNSSRLRIPAHRNQFRWLRPNLVRANPILVFQQQSRGDGYLLGRPTRLHPPDHQHLPARHAAPILPLFPLLRQCRIRFLRLPIRQHASRSRLHLSLPGPARISPAPRSPQSAHPPRDLSSSLGMVPHLLRVRHSQNRQRRSSMAPFHRHG